MDYKRLLEDVRDGKLDIDEALKDLENLPYSDMGFAKIDNHRKLRKGLGEVIYCSGKSSQHLLKIFESFYERGEDVLGTRASLEQYNLIKEKIDIVQYDEESRILKIDREEKAQVGEIAICTGGTSDIHIAEEAAQVAEYFGNKVSRYYDVGVAGIHRLFSKLEEIERANVIIAIAGMEGALPGVLAGMVNKPVIGLPTSIGYGTNFGGVSALLTMLNSCAEGVSVVNIDNGFGAAYVATQINRTVEGING